MCFHIAALDSGVVLELSDGGSERVTQGYVQILMGVILAGLPAGGDFSAGNAQLEAYVIAAALSMMLGWGLDGDVAARDPGVEALQASHFVPGNAFDGL